VRGVLVLLIALTAVAAASGCGTSADRREVRAVVERFDAAIERGDGQAACEQLTEGAASELESAERKPCEEAILSLELDPSPAAVVEVHVVSASAELAGGGTTFLDETSQGWKISAVGCVPRPERPYDCELEA
jgi:hypothetical protein